MARKSRRGDEILDFSKMVPYSAEEDTKDPRIIRNRKRAANRRIASFSKVWPVEVAEFLAAIGVPIRSQNERDRSVKRQLKKLLEDWQFEVEDNMSRGFTRERSIKIMLEQLARDNRDIWGRTPFNIFSYGSK